MNQYLHFTLLVLSIQKTVSGLEDGHQEALDFLSPYILNRQPVSFKVANSNYRAKGSPLKTLETSLNGQSISTVVASDGDDVNDVIQRFYIYRDMDKNTIGIKSEAGWWEPTNSKSHSGNTRRSDRKDYKIGILDERYATQNRWSEQRHQDYLDEPLLEFTPIYKNNKLYLRFNTINQYLALYNGQTIFDPSFNYALELTVENFSFGHRYIDQAMEVIEPYIDHPEGVTIAIADNSNYDGHVWQRVYKMFEAGYMNNFLEAREARDAREQKFILRREGNKINFQADNGMWIGWFDATVDGKRFYYNRIQENDADHHFMFIPELKNGQLYFKCWDHPSYVSRWGLPTNNYLTFSNHDGKRHMHCGSTGTPWLINAHACADAQVTDVEYLGSKAKSDYLHTKIIGVATKSSCGWGESTLAIQKSDCTTNSFSTSTETTIGINWGFSMTHGVSVDAKPLGVGVSTSYETSWSVGGSVEQSLGFSSDRGTEECVTPYAANNFDNPGAGVVIAYADVFKVPEHTRRSRLTMTCPDQRHMQLTVNTRVLGTTYTSTKFKSHANTYPPRLQNDVSQCRVADACLDALFLEKQKEYPGLIDALEQVHSVFEMCIGEGWNDPDNNNF